MKATFLLAVIVFLMAATAAAQPEAAPVCQVNGERPPGAVCINWNNPADIAPPGVHYFTDRRIVTDIGSAGFSDKKIIELRGALNYDNSDPGPYAKEDRKWSTACCMKIAIEFLDLLEGNLVGTVTNPNVNEPIPFKPGTKARIVVVYKASPYGPRVVSMKRSNSSLRAYVY